MNEGALGVIATGQAWGFLQVFLRIVALFAVAPVFGAREVPATARIGLALLFSLVVYPLVRRSLSAPPSDVAPLVLAALGETVVGLLIGLTLSLLFQAALVAGDLIDLQIGFSMAAVFNPALGTQTALMGQFLYRYTLVVFLLLNGHHVLLDALIDSFESLPAARFSLEADGLRLAADLVATVFGVGLRLAAPVVATLLVVDIAFALISRAVPQMNVFVVGMPVKVVVGLVVFVVGLGLTTSVLQDYVGGAPGEMLGLLRTLRGR